MQAYALTVDKFLDHAARWTPGRGVVSAEGARVGYAALRERSNLLSGALLDLGLQPGERAATLAWNTQHHLEAYYALMGAGLVCHTLNPRLTAAQLAEMVVEAEDRALVVSTSLAPLAAELVALCPRLEVVVWADGEAEGRLRDLGPQVAAWDLDRLIAERGRSVAWGEFDEETPAGLCYTSGTTGRPKGVLYTHRSNHLHTLRALQADAIGLTGADTVLAAVPMFHANGWGLPFAAPAAGSDLVLPGRNLDGASLAGLMRREAVTVAVGVQTVWLGLADHLDEVGGDLPVLERVLIGGSRCPDALIARLEARLGARVQASWGMTELSPLGTIDSPRGPAPAARASGRPRIGLDMRLTDSTNTPLVEQRGVMGRLKVRGSSVVDRYFKADADAVDAEGWFDTGDLAVIDADGELTISGRSKDLIKSGGEWINPAEIEDIVGRLPTVNQVAVIGREDARWGERPVLVVELLQGRRIEQAELIAALRGKVADWWLPSEVVVVARMPLAATGKIDKTRLRADYVNGVLAA